MFRPHKYEGGHHAQDLADFVEDILRPVVVPLTVSDYLFLLLIYALLTCHQAKSFHQKVGAKAEEEIWLVDFYAPWSEQLLNILKQNFLTRRQKNRTTLNHF